ncbi:MAG: histidine kinase dimerization/phospho-acceptor domain-containing protein [Chloracidobacterium sp.]
MAVNLHRMQNPRGHALAAGFVAVALILIGLLVASSLTVRQLRSAQAQAGQSLEVLQLVSSAEDAALRTRLYTRGYVITGNGTDMEQARQQAGRLQDVLGQLRARTQSSPSQRERVEQLEEVLLEGKAYLERITELRRIDREAALEMVPGPVGDRLAENLTRVLGAMAEEARTDFNRFATLVHTRTRTLEWLIVFSVSVILLLLVTTYWVVSSELNQRRRLTLQLEHARDAALNLAQKKSDFLANMSHEIRTPMNGIIGMIELLLRTPLNANQRDLAETIRYSADALLVVVNDILDFSKIEAGKLTLEANEFDLRDTVEQSTETLAAAAREKSLELVTLITGMFPNDCAEMPGASGRCCSIWSATPSSSRTRVRSWCG